mgnify:FL=1
MALYVVENVTPANTPATAPLNTRLALPPGILRKVALQFPSGCAGLVEAQVLRGGTQIWPTRLSATFSSDGYTIEFEERYEVPQEEDWYLRTWNVDDTYPHTITLWLTMDVAAVTAEASTQDLLDSINSYLAGAEG